MPVTLPWPAACRRWAAALPADAERDATQRRARSGAPASRRRLGKSAFMFYPPDAPYLPGRGSHCRRCDSISFSSGVHFEEGAIWRTEVSI